MSQTIKLLVESRTTVGKASKKLRRQGVLPGVIYGYNVKEPLLVQVDGRTFERVYHRAGNVHLVDLQMGETGGMTRAFIQAVKRDPVTHVLTHIDFRAVNLLEEVTTRVPILLEGEPPVVAATEGVLLQNLDGLDVKVLPTDVPESFTVDLGGLTEVGDAIYVKDIPVPTGVTVLNDLEEIVVRITATRVVAEEEEAATEAAEAEAAEGEGAES